MKTEIIKRKADDFLFIIREDNDKTKSDAFKLTLKDIRELNISLTDITDGEI